MLVNAGSKEAHLNAVCAVRPVQCNDGLLECGRASIISIKGRGEAQRTRRGRSSVSHPCNIWRWAHPHVHSFAHSPLSVIHAHSIVLGMSAASQTNWAFSHPCSPLASHIARRVIVTHPPSSGRFARFQCFCLAIYPVLPTTATRTPSAYLHGATHSRPRAVFGLTFYCIHVASKCAS